MTPRYTRLPLCCRLCDGSRLLVRRPDPRTARSTMDAAMEQHGMAGNWVTDENYRNGEYYKLIPPPPHFPFPILDLSDCQTEKSARSPKDRLKRTANGVTRRKPAERPSRPSQAARRDFLCLFAKLFFRCGFLARGSGAYAHIGPDQIL